jgi:catecholate siderophore receptor
MASKRIKRKTRATGSMRGRRYWLAVGTLAAYSATSSGKMALAEQVTRRDPGAATSIQSMPVRRFDIPAGPLDEAVKSFSKVTGITVNAATNGILSVYSPGAKGSYTPEQALQAMLNNTGLQYTFVGNNAVTLELQSSTTSVNVTASLPTIAASMPKYQMPSLDTPQTITAVSQKTMQQQGVTTLRDAMRNVAGISLAAGEGGAQGDNLTVRGFTARNDLFIDGMRDFGSYYRDPFNTEEVQVLQGPSSVTFGRGSTGGIVNQASKTPNLNQFIDVGLQFGTDTTRRATTDVNIPFTMFGEQSAFRVSAMGNIGNVAGRDVATNRRTGIAPSLAFGLGTPTRITLSYFHQNADDNPDYGIPWLFNGPSPVDRNNYYGLQTGNYLRTYDDIGTAKVEHDVNAHVVVRDQFRYANYARNALITEAQTTGVTFGTPLDQIMVSRHEIGVVSTETFLDNQLDMIANFNTGFIKHNVVSGLEGSRETSDPTRPNWTAPNTSLLNPDYTQSLNPNPTINTRVTDSAVSGGAYAIDSAQIGTKVIVSGGIRFDRFDNTYKQLFPTVVGLERVDQQPTWRAAAVYKPVAKGSVYFAASTSFNPSAESLSLSTSTVNVAPEKNKTYEVGTKWDFGRRLSANAAWFRTTKYNAREPDPNNPLLNVLAGTQKVSGTQIDIRSHITSRWDMIAGYAFLDSKVVGSQFYPNAIGYQLANVPRNTFNAWSTYHLPQHLEIGAGANYVSSRTASSTVPLDPTTQLPKQVPGYWIFSAMASRPFGEHVSVQVNVYNLADRYYYDQLHPAHIIVGAGRSALFGFHFRF